MKNKNILGVALCSLVVFILVASYLWYLYFHEYESKIMAENPNMEFLNEVEFVNSGPIDYVNAKVDDEDSIIPIYYFSIKNKSNKDFKYDILLEDAEASDGCSTSSRLHRDELIYELKLDNKTIKKTGIDTISNNVIDSNTIKGNSTNDYSLKIKLKEGITDYEKKHFHYVIKLKEKK